MQYSAGNSAEILGIPPPDVTQTLLLPVAYTQGGVLYRVDRERPEDVTDWNRWGAGRETLE